MYVRIALGMSGPEFVAFCAALRLPFPVDGYPKIDPPQPDVLPSP